MSVPFPQVQHSSEILQQWRSQADSQDKLDLITPETEQLPQEIKTSESNKETIQIRIIDLDKEIEIFRVKAKVLMEKISEVTTRISTHFKHLSEDIKLFDSNALNFDTLLMAKFNAELNELLTITNKLTTMKNSLIENQKS